MKELYEVTLTFTALVLADDAEDAEEIARQERGEITSDMDPKIESGCTFRSRQELDAHNELNECGLRDDCPPYGGSGRKTVGAILEDIEEADASAAEALAGRCPDTVDMFEAPKPETAPQPELPPDFNLLAARKFANAGDDWHWCNLEFVGSGACAGAIIEGGVPNIDHEGKRRWTGIRLERVVVTEVERVAVALAWEQETGKCYVCAGSGQECTGWHYQVGNKFRPCVRCGATGKAVKS